MVQRVRISSRVLFFTCEYTAGFGFPGVSGLESRASGFATETFGLSDDFGAKVTVLVASVALELSFDMVVPNPVVGFDASAGAPNDNPVAGFDASAGAPNDNPVAGFDAPAGAPNDSPVVGFEASAEAPNDSPVAGFEVPAGAPNENPVVGFEASVGAPNENPVFVFGGSAGFAGSGVLNENMAKNDGSKIWLKV